MEENDIEEIVLEIDSSSFSAILLLQITVLLGYPLTIMEMWGILL